MISLLTILKGIGWLIIPWPVLLIILFINNQSINKNMLNKQ